MDKTVLFLLTILCHGTKIRPENIARIIGGKNAGCCDYIYVLRVELERTIEENPLKVSRLHKCTGSALTAKWTLTAAHCIDSFVPLDEHSRGVVMADNRPDGPQASECVKEITEYLKHPSFRDNLPYSYTNDVGLLKHEPIILKQYARISLLNYRSLVGMEAVTAGYGFTHFTFNDTVVMGDTLAMDLPLQVLEVVVTECGGVPLWPGLCVGARCVAGWAAVCAGDVGAPLLLGERVAAVASLGDAYDCYVSKLSKMQIGITGAYTPISPFIPWISKKVAERT